VLYLLDASVLITASNSYYSIDRVPEFWDWLSHVGSQDKVKIPLEIFEEIKDGSDVRWILKSSATPEVFDEGLGGCFIAETFSGG